MSGVDNQAVDFSEVGYFRVFAAPPGGVRREITFFRGSPVTVSGISTADPFTDMSASLQCPQITAWDTFGTGDLDWLVPYADIDIVWEASNPAYDYKWSFEGFIASHSLEVGDSSSSVSLDIKGALLLLDNYLAAPTFPSQPVPYELLMQQCFDQDTHPARLSNFSVEFPDGWGRKVPSSAEYDQMYQYSFLRPWGVVPGQIWTGFTTRSTGGWENMLTGFIQGLLSVMFEEGGAQWTIRKDEGRKPVLMLRTIPESTDPTILEVDLGTPGVSLSLSRDFTQSANTIYGDGSDTAGTTFSGAQVSGDGTFTSYTPFASAANVWPVDADANPSRNQNIIPKEAHIKFPAGMDFIDAQALARAQKDRFADPGFTGTLTLKVDPFLASGAPFLRFLIKAGQTIRIKGLLGIPGGVLCHITQSSVEVNEQTVTLTIDSKYRDQLTVSEVQARTRDALTPLRSLQVGKYTNTVQDLLLPWSYATGSGVIPSGGTLDATDFFTKLLPAGAQFPYEKYTMQYPPSSPSSRNFYIKIGPKDINNADNNWSGATRNGGQMLAIPMKMGQQGSIRLLQVAAYKKDGSLFPVKFHLSIYSNNGTGVSAMPWIPGTGKGTRVFTYPMLIPPGGENYKVGQRYPFYKTAWETVNENGETYTDIGQRFPETAGFVVGYGNYFEPAGFFPGRFSRGATPTGQLVDEATWSWDLTSTLDPQSQANTAKIADAGMLFVMIYCDDQLTEDVYFMGRAFRVEPGQG